MRACRLQNFITACLVSVSLAMLRPAQAQASTEAEQFFTSCVYGTMAGAAIGAASLAFTRRPSQNFGRVAEGASLGLYAGIFLGIYVVSESSSDSARTSSRNLLVYPLLSDKGVEGGALDYAVYHF